MEDSDSDSTSTSSSASVAHAESEAIVNRHAHSMSNHNELHEVVPELIGRMKLNVNYNKRPPAIDRHRSDAELDDMAAEFLEQQHQQQHH